MKANFRAMPGSWMGDKELDEHADWLASFTNTARMIKPGVGNTSPPEGYESMVTVDVFGPEFVWMNQVFPREHYEWYILYESVFLVPPEMATFLKIRWR